MAKIFRILLFLLPYCGFVVRAQDVAFSIPYSSNPIYLNPAYAGLPGYWRAGANYHYQGVGDVSPYMAYSVYADYFWDNKNSGAAIFALGDRMTTGSITKTQIAAVYTYRLKIGNIAALRMALQPAINFASYDAGAITFPDQIDHNGLVTNDGGLSASSTPVFDVSMGLVFSYSRFYAGAAMHHLAAVNTMSVGGAAISVPLKFTFNAGYNYSFLLYENSVSMTRRGGYSLRLSPNVAVAQQGASNYFLVGTYATLLNVGVGLHYKSSIGNSPHFFVVSAHYVGERIGVSYSFEFGSFNESFSVVPSNSHEISVSFKFQTIAPKAPLSSYTTYEEEKIYDSPDI